MTPVSTSKVPSRKGHWLAVVGASAQVVALLVMAGYLAVFVHSVMNVDPHPEQGAMMNPQAGEVLWTGVVGSVSTLIKISCVMAGIAVPGAVLILISINSCGYRAAWLYRLLVVVGMIYLAVFPLGTLLGAGFLVIASSKRREMIQGRVV